MKRTLKEQNNKLIELWNGVIIKDFKDAQNTKVMARQCFNGDDNTFIMNIGWETTIGVKYRKDGYEIFDYVSTKYVKNKLAYEELASKIREKQNMKLEGNK